MLNDKQFKVLRKIRSNFQISIQYSIECDLCGYIFIVLKKTIDDKKNILRCPNCNNEV